MKKTNQFISSILLLSLLLAGCSNEVISTSDEIESTNDGGSEETSTTTLSFDFTQEDLQEEVYDETIISLNGASASFEGLGVSVEGGIITISADGDYVISGTLNEGQLIVEAADDAQVHIVFAGVSITNSSGATVVINRSDKTIITLQDGTSNVLKDGASVTQSEEEPNATLYSASDLVLNGSGELIISANYNHGIYSLDDLRLIDVNISVDANNDAIKGKDVIWASNVTLNLVALGDGLVSSNAEDVSLGNILIENSVVNIQAGLDGIQAENSLQINSGSFNIISGTLMTSEDSGKGLKAVNEIIIESGDFIISAKDDSIHSDTNVIINDGSLSLSSGDDGIHGNASLIINGGDINILESYEGLESAAITLNSGTVHLVSFDDGINGSSGSGESMQADGNVVVVINGGTLIMDASGDGLDSNGSLVMNDGMVIVFGPTNSGNGAIDYNGQFTLNGGTLLALGSSGMAQQASNSTQNTVLINFAGVSAGETVSIVDASGNIIMSVIAIKSFSSIVYSGVNLVNGDYTLVSGGISEAIYSDSVAFSGSIGETTSIGTFTITDTITSYGSSSTQPGGTGTRPSRN